MQSLIKYIRSLPDFPKPGIIFRDITPLIENAEAFSQSINELSQAVRAFGKIDKIAAPEARGFIFGAPLSILLNAGLIPVRKPGKLPYQRVSVSYDLEYGTDSLEIHEDSIQPGDRILILDDLLATGGTVSACRQLVEKQGGIVVGFAFVIELVDLKGRQKLGENVESLITFEGE